MTASGFLALTVSDCLTQNRKLDWDFRLSLAQFQRVPVYSLQESVAWEIGVSPLGDSNRRTSDIELCDVLPPKRSLATGDRRTAMWLVLRQT